MRDYLFRGKRIDNGEWVCGNLFVPDNPDKPVEILIGTNSVRISYEVIPETVGQYTGLNDKNGKKIFEGDIVNFKTTAYFFHNCKIEYDICDGCFRAVDRNAQSFPMCGCFIYEVIGNIHDNPKLMKGRREECLNT